ncbi:hypothetical protein ACMFMG_003138 [Clarireedia jacksonii]
MNPPSTRIRKRRALQRPLPDTHQTPLLRRRSSRIQSKLSTVSISQILGSYYESQSSLKQRPTDPQTSQPVSATSYTRVADLGLVEVSALVPSRLPCQEYPCPPQTHNDQTRKRRSVETGAERPPQRARLTKKNLKAFEKVGQDRKKSTGQSSSTTTTTDKDFGTKLQKNGVVYTSFDARAPDDIAKTRELLDRSRDSEPPDRSDYQEYLVLTEDYENELGVEISAYPLLAKRTAKRGISGYFQRPNHTWSAVDNHITTGLSDTQPDLVESYRKTDYPPTVVEALSGDLAPSSYNDAMPAYAVEFKSTNGDMKEAKLQCAYDGALMTEGAHGVHTYIGRPDDDFYGRTQALTVAFNGETLNFYAHHAVKVPVSSTATYKASGSGVDGSAEAANVTATTVEYHQYLVDCDNPRVSFEHFQTAYRHTRNAQDIGYTLATERKDALWAYTNRDNAKNPPHVPTSAQQLPSESSASVSLYTSDGVPIPAQQQTDTAVPVSSGSLDGYNYDAYGNPITPPQSSKDISAPLEQQLSIPTVIEHKKTRGRTRHAATTEGPQEVRQKPKTRKTRTKNQTS